MMKKLQKKERNNVVEQSGRGLSDIEMAEFKNVITPIYQNGEANVEVMDLSIFSHCDKYWSADFPYNDKVGERIGYDDIVTKQDIITQTFKNRFFALMKTNVEGLFESYANAIVNDPRTQILNREIKKIDYYKIDYYPTTMFSRNLPKELQDDDKYDKNDYIKELIYYFKPTRLEDIYSDRMGSTGELDNFDIYRKAFKITTYFTEDPTITGDMTNLFSTYLIRNVMGVMKMSINDQASYALLKEYVTRLADDLFDILSMIFISMYETAKQYLEYTSYLCNVVDNFNDIKEGIYPNVEFDDDYTKEDHINTLNSIINAATAKLEAMKNNK